MEKRERENWLTHVPTDTKQNLIITTLKCCNICEKHHFSSNCYLQIQVPQLHFMYSQFMNTMSEETCMQFSTFSDEKTCMTDKFIQISLVICIHITFSWLTLKINHSLPLTCQCTKNSISTMVQHVSLYTTCENFCHKFLHKSSFFSVCSITAF